MSKKTEPTFYYPNADLCLNCANIGPSCSKLNFKEMPRIKVVQDFGIEVRCTQYVNNPDASSVD